MALAREETILLVLLLVALGLLAFGVVELVWPRRRATRAARAPIPIPIPVSVAPPALPLPVLPPAPPMTVEELLDQATQLADFPLRALVLLHRADEQLAQLAHDAPQTAALQLRVSAAHASVGRRLFEDGLAEQALPALLRVLSRNAVGGEDLRRAREAFVGALTTIAAERGHVIRRLANEGNTAAANAHSDRLLALLRAGLDTGLTETDLAAALATAHRVFAHVGLRRVVATG